MGVFLLLLAVALEGKAQSGGGIYVKSGGKVIGTVIHGNLAEDGYGLAGEDAQVINSTICMNGPIGNIMDGIKPGDIYCADDTVRSRANYVKRAKKDAIGVVFWVNSDYYAAYPRGYVVALESSRKDWETGSILYVPVPISDTVCYTKTQALATIGNKAAVYCAEYAVDGEEAGRWCMPAGRHLSLLYTNQVAVSETLDWLFEEGSDQITGTVSFLEQEKYWSVTEADNQRVWLLDFEEVTTINSSMTKSGAFVRIDPETDGTAYIVRPIFVY
ncbi:MAG: hypothetical protein LBR65_06360 [Culturomica sp.]|jgi:hypothetical protein|nr:hypothetical protein [Culturomica sp.]